QLVELGALMKVVVIDHDGIYDPRLVNDRLLLGLKGIMSDFEMATLRQRALEAQRTKAQRGELWMHLPVGLVYGPTGAIELDPDVRVQAGDSPRAAEIRRAREHTPSLAV